MSYRNKTYVIFDADTDFWAYRFMCGWKANEKIDFNFHDAHDLRPISKDANEKETKRSLRARLANTKQAVVLIGEKTKNLYRFVRWELEECLSLDIPIIAVNLDGSRSQNDETCPPIIRDRYVVHVPFKMKIIRHALDNFPREYHARKSDSGPRYYTESVYNDLEI